MLWLLAPVRRTHPRPISSARMQPCWSGLRSPITHSYMKRTPDAWCGLQGKGGEGASDPH